MNDSILPRYTDGNHRTVPATPGPSRTRLLGCVVALIALMVFLCAGAAWAVDFETRQAESASALPDGTYLYDDPQIVTIGKDSVLYENDATVDYRFSVGQYRTVKQIAVRSRTGIASNNNVDINLVVDGQPLAPKTIPKDATSYQDRTWAVDLPSGDHTIGVRGTNINAHDKLYTDYIVLSGSESQPPSSDGCDVVASPGNNTLETKVNNLSAGQTLCAHGGIYTESDDLFRFTSGGTATNPITLKSYPGETAELRGSIRTTENAAGFILGDKGANWPAGDGLRIDLSYGVIKFFHPAQDNLLTDEYNTEPIHWDSDGGGIYGNNISNRDPSGDTTRAGMGILMAGGNTDVVGSKISGNYLHNCGQLPRNNHEHCLYLTHMRGGSVHDNLIYDSADRGIQNYSSPDSVDESGNLVVDTHDTGMNVCGTASNINMHNNVVVFSANENFTACPAFTGLLDQFDDNCVYMDDGTDGVFGDLGIKLYNNITANPQLDANWNTGVVTVTNPTCAAKLPADSRFRP